MTVRHERVLAALELREPDRVPTMDMMVEYANIYEILGRRTIPMGRIFENRHARRVIDFVAAHAFTTLPVDLAMEGFTRDRAEAAARMGYDSAWVAHVPIWNSGDSRNFADIYGRQWELTFDGHGNLGTPMYKGGLIDSPGTWKAWDKSGIFKLPPKNHRAYSRVQKDVGDRLFVFGSFSAGLFELTWQSLGFERFVRATRGDRDFLRRLIRFYTDFFNLVVEAIADAGIPGLILPDDLAYRSGPMLNPKMLEELYGEAYRSVTDTAHRLGMKVIIHSCGNVLDLLNWFADCGFDGVHALEPTAGVTLREAKRIAGDRLCLVGNVDVTRTLVDASREEVFEEVRLSIEDAGAGGGYMVAPTNSHPGISVRHLRWMLEAVREYGSYGDVRAAPG